MKVLVTMLLLGLVVGCSKRPTASDVVSRWADLGMSLPPAEDVAFIRDRLPESLDSLRLGLADRNDHIRMSSAYVAEKLGSQAGPLVQVVIDRLQSEPAPIIRVYLASATAEIGQVTPHGMHQLEDSFRAEQNEQVKTHIAGALVRLGSVQEEPAAWQWLLQSMAVFPPDPPADASQQQVFWERRWGAVEHLRRIRGNGGALLPLLKNLKANPKTPRWVIDQQVDVAISEMEAR